ncbi:MAG: hypothetical protein LBS96_03840, partial [Oscillospiraceae bacterium]|nr:hypothetical protein [Oscillospiraceae bacterium]
MGKKEGESARHSYGLWFFLAVVAVLTMGLSAWCFLTLHSMKKATPGDNPPVVVQYEKNAEVSEVLLKNEVREIVRAEYETYQNDMQNMLAVAAIVFTIFSIAMPIMNYVFLQKEHVEKLREQMQDVENAKTNAEAAQKAAQAAEKDAERLVFSMLAKLAEVNEIKTAIEGRLATCEIENCNANNRMNMMMEQFRNFSNQLSAMQSGKETGQGQGATIQPLSDSVEDKADAFYKRYLAAPRGSKQELELISEAVKLAPNNAHYVANRGYALHRLKRYEEALEDETEAIRLEPTNAEYYQARGSTLHEIKDYEKALADKTEAVRLEQTNAVYYHQR